MLVPSTRSMFLCPCCLIFVVVQFKYHVKCLELFKIRSYIKYPLLLLLLLLVANVTWTISIIELLLNCILIVYLIIELYHNIYLFVCTSSAM